jgi:hypothetical protein
MFTILAALFVLFALDGVFRGRTLYDDSWRPGDEGGEAPPSHARLRAVLWGALAILCLVIASKYEW